LYDSSVKGVRSDDEDEVNMKHEMIVDDEKVIEWAKVSHRYSSFINTIRWLLSLLAVNLILLL
jgi:hypothetical protein